MRNIIITGGELFNKGAQAMTFITVNELRKRFPNRRIYLLSEMDLERPIFEREQYKFDFMGWYPIKFARCQHNLFLRLFCKLRNGRELTEAENIYKNCDAMIDISGYALGSNWSDATCHRYLDHLEFAKAFGIPVYLMPQSFGPFEFEGDRKSLDARIRRLLPTVKVICAREQEGYDALVSTYGLTNVRLAHDLVLCNKGVQLSNIYKTIPLYDLPEIREHSVGIIPNSRNAEVGSDNAVMTLYDEIIASALARRKTVYLLSHSNADAKLCGAIKERFEKETSVVLLDQDFCCLEFNELVKKFDYLIASRFHSIVHAYKNGVPCIALGWATKYHDLLKLFGQEQYVFDIRGEIGAAEMLEAVNRMDAKYPEESKRIQRGLSALQEENVFDVLNQQQKEFK